MRFGVSRAYGGSHLVTGVHRFAEALTELTGETTRVSVEAVAAGTVDLAWMPPLTVAEAIGAGGISLW